MEIKGILFDKDGTLIDFYEVWGTAVAPVIDGLLARYGLTEVPALREAMMERIGVAGGKIDPEGALAWKPYPLIAEDLLGAMGELAQKPSANELTQALIDGFEREVSEKRQQYPVFTDLRALMRGLCEKGIHIGIATTDERRSTEICMEKLGIAERISFYGTAGSGLPVKPDGALVRKAAALWGIDPSEIAVVGDTPNDMRFAHNGGALAVAVLSGVGKKEDLQALADEMIDSVSDLSALLEQPHCGDKRR